VIALKSFVRFFTLEFHHQAGSDRLVSFSR